MTAGRWAFSDESERANRMLFSVVLVPVPSVARVRADLRALLLPGERRMHTAKESPRRRRALLDTVPRLDSVAAVVFSCRRDRQVGRPDARHALLRAATTLVVDHSVSAWTLDDQEPVQRSRDRACIERALQARALDCHPVYDHQPAHGEPLLWAADAVCWAVGAGGEWRQRIGSVLTVRQVEP